MAHLDADPDDQEIEWLVGSLANQIIWDVYTVPVAERENFEAVARLLVQQWGARQRVKAKRGARAQISLFE